MTWPRVKNKKVQHENEVEWRDCCSLHSVTSSVIYYSTHTRKNVISIVLCNKNSKGLLKILGHVWGIGKDKNKPSDVIWHHLTSSDIIWRHLTSSDVIWRHLCICPLLDHRQQPMKMHTEVTLLYNLPHVSRAQVLFRRKLVVLSRLLLWIFPFVDVCIKLYRDIFLKIFLKKCFGISSSWSWIRVRNVPRFMTIAIFFVA